MPRPRPMLPTVNYTAPRCATCTYWAPNAMGTGRCNLTGGDGHTTDAPMHAEGIMVTTRLDFGCIFHEKAAE